MLIGAVARKFPLLEVQNGPRFRILSFPRTVKYLSYRRNRKTKFWRRFVREPSVESPVRNATWAEFCLKAAGATEGPFISGRVVSQIGRAGNGVKQDYPEAVKWFRKAAEQNYALG